jgi:hypothetical protein
MRTNTITAAGAGIASLSGGSGWTGAAIGAVVGGIVGDIKGKDNAANN